MEPFDLLTASGCEIARKIREGETSSREAVKTHIRRIQKANPAINAVVAERFDQALDEAAAADAFLAENGPDACPPYHGVPCTIKEAFSLIGMPNSSGLVSRKNLISRENAPTVERLLNAGAIPMGVTNVSELCIWMESSNRVHGRTGNPYDPGRIAGGSSGGEGSIIGAGASPFGLGSDVGGSIRMPAFFNGVFGHKPTAGLIPNSGQYPVAEEGVSGTCTTGPLCRRAEDLWPLVRILAGPDGRDPGCRAIPLGHPDSVDVSALAVTSVPDNGLIPVAPDLKAAQRAVARALAGKGCRVGEARFPALKKSLLLWSAVLQSAHGTPFGTLLGNGRPINPFLELARYATGKSPHTIPAIFLALLEKIPMSEGRNLADFQRLRTEMLERMGETGILLYPSYSGTAPRHGRPLLQAIHWVYTAIVNALGFPSTQVPLGLSRQGLPLGVQVISAPGNDHITVAVAQTLEAAFGGWVPPFSRNHAL